MNYKVLKTRWISWTTKEKLILREIMVLTEKLLYHSIARIHYWPRLQFRLDTTLMVSWLSWSLLLQAQLDDLVAAYKKAHKAELADEIGKKCSGDLRTLLLGKLGKGNMMVIVTK